MKLIFSGIDKSFFSYLAFNNQVTASWLSIEELMSSGHEVDNNDIKYVLFYNSPEAFLSEGGNKSIGNLVTAEQQWLPQTELLSQFYLAHKTNAILVNSEQCEINTDAFTALVNKKFNIDSQVSNIKKISEKLNNDANKLLDQSLKVTILTELSDNDAIQNTYENITSAADLLVASDDYTLENRAIILLDNCQKLVDKINDKYSKYTYLVKQNESSLTQVQQLQEELESKTSQHKTSEEKLKLNTVLAYKTNDELTTANSNYNQLAQEKIKIENRITQLTSKNELSLLQIQQLQEELEATLIENITSEEKLKLNTELANKTNDELTTANSNYNQLAQEKIKIVNSITQLTNENELSLLQIQQLQEELEATFIENKTTEEKLKLNTELANRTNDELTIVNSNNKQLAQEKTKLESSIAELTTENELSLLQIQKLQEESETTFLEHQQYKQAEQVLEQKNNEHISELKTENEIALLQIQQLQEELEFYFIKYQSLNSNSFISNINPINTADKRFEKSLTLSKFLRA
jgi:hypothetical protein